MEPDPALAGAYNLPDGIVPVLDGRRCWPWDEAVARQRLAEVARRLGISPSGHESMLDGASNDTWLLGETVLTVCWRGDLDRLARAADLLAALPATIPRPRVLDHGRDERLSWLLSTRATGTPLSALWPTRPEPQLRDLVAELAEHLTTLHAWTPPTVFTPPDTDDALRITGTRIIPLSAREHASLIAHARTLPFVPPDLLDALAARLAAARTALDDAPPAFLHGDASPGNVLVADGRISALLDFEWSWFGPSDAELALPLFWASCQPSADRAERYVDWLGRFAPDVVATHDIDERRWLFRAAFALRCVLHWPPDRPEERLYPDHPIAVLRRLLAQDSR